MLSQKQLMDIIGSWNKEGYHGHNRAKSRIEFSNSYRLSAKPNPPEKFKLRYKDNAIKHNFSKHDNKQAFLNDPDLFSNGVGKKKVETLNKARWNPELIAWKNECGRGLEPKRTLYQRDFCNTKNDGSRLLLNRERYETPQITSYSNAFSHGEPGKTKCHEIQKDMASRYVFQNRAKTCVPKERMSVASCMVWKIDNVANKCQNNAATVEAI